MQRPHCAYAGVSGWKWNLPLSHNGRVSLHPALLSLHAQLQDQQLCLSASRRAWRAGQGRKSTPPAGQVPQQAGEASPLNRGPSVAVLEKLPFSRISPSIGPRLESTTKLKEAVAREPVEPANSAGAPAP